MSKQLTVVVKPKESIIQCAIKDLMTFVMLGFSVYISQQSTFWTFVTGLMFIMFAFIKVSAVYKKQVGTFTSKDEAIGFINDNFEV